MQSHGSADDWGAEAVEAGQKVEDVAREVGVSKHYGWKAKYGGMDVSQVQEAKQLRDENTQLRKLVADRRTRFGMRSESGQMLTRTGEIARLGASLDAG